MVYSTELCSTCRGILCPNPNVKSSRRIEGCWIEATGQTFKVFREAVEQGCAICCTIWNLDDRHAKAWPQISPEAWNSVSLYYCKDVVENNIIKVCVSHHDPIKQGPAFLWLYLISSNGVHVRWMRNSVTNPSVVKIAAFDLSLDSEYKINFELPQIEPSTSPTTTLITAYNWFANCRLSHPRCRKPATPRDDWLPTRLIDIGQGGANWRLCIVSEDGIPRHSAPYITLSYR
ncbi:hypothetical protein NUW58_g8553 [Xylaria curta]|uniref:Uncharacterized protein n=1 Tax=Xylaria curta TaxID=42375 RepID=A0ACC1N775_9PEZI|nr:hypothetical protein NUW58_g8553 [Xylaria curta]